MYQWWVFVHLVGVFGFLLAHGVSVGVAFRLRRERNIDRVAALLDLSSRAITPFYISLLVLVVTGVVATFLGRLWSYGWIWGAIVTLVVVSVAMYAMATTYFKRVRFIVQAMGEGTKAVTDEQLDEVLGSRRPVTIAGIGFAGLAFILYLMLFKPTLGLAPSGGAQAAPPPSGPVVEIGATELEFTTDRLEVPAEEAFAVRFDNRGAGVPHNVAIYEDDSATDGLFVGELVTGPATVTYQVDPLEPDTYFFQCDVHPTTMTGTLVAE